MTYFDNTRPKTRRGHGAGNSDGRWKLGRNAMVDAAIARLRRPPQQVVSGSPRMPAKPAYGSSLVSADEFYAHAGITSRPSTTSRPAAQANPNAIKMNQLDSEKQSVVNRGVISSTIGGSESARLISPPAYTSEKLDPIKNVQSAVSNPAGYGLAGLAGSCWAEQSASNPSTTDLAPSKNTKNAISASTPASPVSPPISSDISEVKPLPVSNKIIIRSFDGVKIRGGSLSEVLGVVRIVTYLGCSVVNLEILINNELVLDEALYSSDTFMEENGTITFQPYSEKGHAPIWRLTCSLPYQSTVLTDTVKGRVRNGTRPIREQQSARHQNAKQDNGPLPVEMRVKSEEAAQTVPPLPTDSSTTCTVEDSQLLIDFNAKDATQSYISPTVQALMALMTDERAITNFLERLNQPTGGAFLDHIFSITGHSPQDGYSPQMLLASKNLVFELYAQSDVFQRLPLDIRENLVEETSQKVLEKALSSWHVQPTGTTRLFQDDEQDDAMATLRPMVYSPDELLNLRSRASTIEGRLISEYDKMSTNMRSFDSTKSTSLSGESTGATVGRNTPIQQVAPDSVAKSSVVSSSSMNTLSSTIVTVQLKPEPITRESYNKQKGPVFTMLRSDIEVERQDSTESGLSHEKKNSSSSAGSYNIKEGAMPTTPFKRNIPSTVKVQEDLVSIEDSEQDRKSESTDSELVVKLKGLNIGQTPALLPSLSGQASLIEEKESSISNQPATSSIESPASIMEIDNGDLKGNPGLAASKWAIDTNQSSPTSKLRRTLSSRDSRMQRMPQVTPHLKTPHSRQPSIPLTPQPQAAGIHQSPYDFTPQNVTQSQGLTPQQPLMPLQTFMPQFTTVLVTDPFTGEVREVTGVQKVATPNIPIPNHLPSFAGNRAPPAQPVTFGPFTPLTFMSPNLISKPYGSSPLSPGAQSYLPDAKVQSSFSPHRENTPFK